MENSNYEKVINLKEGVKFWLIDGVNKRSYVFVAKHPLLLDSHIVCINEYSYTDSIILSKNELNNSFLMLNYDSKIAGQKIIEGYNNKIKSVTKIYLE